MNRDVQILLAKVPPGRKIVEYAGHQYLHGHDLVRLDGRMTCVKCDEQIDAWNDKAIRACLET